jgi:hypothetical protein
MAFGAGVKWEDDTGGRVLDTDLRSRLRGSCGRKANERHLGQAHRRYWCNPLDSTATRAMQQACGLGPNWIEESWLSLDKGTTCAEMLKKFYFNGKFHKPPIHHE